MALAAKDDARQQVLEKFIDASVGELNSTLIEMVRTAGEAGSLLRLESLSHQPGWSAFVQYLAHTYLRSGTMSSLQHRSSRFSEALLAFNRSARATRDGRTVGGRRVCLC